MTRPDTHEVGNESNGGCGDGDDLHRFMKHPLLLLHAEESARECIMTLVPLNPLSRPDRERCGGRSLMEILLW